MLKERIKQISDLLMELDREIGLYTATKPPAEEACELLVQLHQAKADMRVVYDGFSHGVSQVMQDNASIFVSGSEVEKSYSTKRTGWQHKDLARVVAGKLYQMSIDMDTGEVQVSPGDLIAQLLDYVQPAYWKVTALQKLGLNADNYCIAGETKVSIIIRKGGQGHDNN